MINIKEEVTNLKDSDEKYFSSFEEMLEFLDEIQDRTRYRPITLCKVNIDVVKTDNYSLIDESGAYTEIRPCAWNTLLQRLQLAGNALQYNSDLPKLTKSSVLNIVLNATDGDCLAVEQVDKINGFVSMKYANIPLNEVMLSLYNKLAIIYQKDDFPFFGRWNWDMSFGRFNCGQYDNSGKFEIAITFDSSDIGSCAVKIGAELVSPNGLILPLMDDFNIIHKGSADINRVYEDLDGLTCAIERKMNQLEHLKQISIKENYEEILSLCRRVGLPANKVKDKCLLGGVKTAFDVYERLSVLADTSNRETQMKTNTNLLKLFNEGYWNKLRTN